MKKTIYITTLFSFFILLSSPLTLVQAQRIHGMVLGGATLSQIEGDELKSYSQWGFTGGVGAIVGLDKDATWNLSVEATYTQRGSYNGTRDPYSMALTLNYMDIPLMGHFRDPWGGMLLGAGLTYGRLVQQPHGEILYNPNYFVPDTSDMTFLSNDLQATLDIRFPVWKNLWFNIRFQYSLLAVKKDWHFREHRGEEPLLDDEGNPVMDGTGHARMVPHWDKWSNNAYNNSLIFRLIWQF